MKYCTIAIFMDGEKVEGFIARKFTTFKYECINNDPKCRVIESHDEGYPAVLQREHRIDVINECRNEGLEVLVRTFEAEG